MGGEALDESLHFLKEANFLDYINLVNSFAITRVQY